MSHLNQKENKNEAKRNQGPQKFWYFCRTHILHPSVSHRLSYLNTPSASHYKHKNSAPPPQALKASTSNPLLSFS